MQVGRVDRPGGVALQRKGAGQIGAAEAGSGFADLVALVAGPDVALDAKRLRRSRNARAEEGVQACQRRARRDDPGVEVRVLEDVAGAAIGIDDDAAGFHASAQWKGLAGIEEGQHLPGRDLRREGQPAPLAGEGEPVRQRRAGIDICVAGREPLRGFEHQVGALMHETQARVLGLQCLDAVAARAAIFGVAHPPVAQAVGLALEVDPGIAQGRAARRFASLPRGCATATTATTSPASMSGSVLLAQGALSIEMPRTWSTGARPADRPTQTRSMRTVRPELPASSRATTGASHRAWLASSASNRPATAAGAQARARRARRLPRRHRSRFVAGRKWWRHRSHRSRGFGRAGRHGQARRRRNRLGVCPEVPTP